MKKAEKRVGEQLGAQSTRSNLSDKGVQFCRVASTYSSCTRTASVDPFSCSRSGQIQGTRHNRLQHRPNRCVGVFFLRLAKHRDTHLRARLFAAMRNLSEIMHRVGVVSGGKRTHFGTVKPIDPLFCNSSRFVRRSFRFSNVCYPKELSGTRTPANWA